MPLPRTLFTNPKPTNKEHSTKNSYPFSVVPLRTLRIDINPLSRIFDIRLAFDMC